MAQHRPRIVVIGAGIIGSAISYNLAIRGADVLLMDQGQMPGSGVTGKAFGWVNVINGTPGDNSYALWREAVAEFRNLKDALPTAFSRARSGTLLWKATAQETEQFAELHRSAGENVELLQRSALLELEPRLREVPDLAAFSPNDLALDPMRLAGDLVAAAIAAGGSTRFGAAVCAIDTINGKVSGVRVGDEIIAADVVVVAAGAGVLPLTDRLGVQTGLTTSPALLLRYACNRPIINYILRGPRLEIRQASDSTLLVAKSYVENGDENGPRLIGEKMLTVMKDELDLPDEVELKSAEIGDRPIFADGLPRLGFLQEIGSLYLAVGHPGVILAPLIGRMTAEELLEGRNANSTHSPLIGGSLPSSCRLSAQSGRTEQTCS
ncbi:FAD-binding oxidoreductase [Rhizobium sullae]|uniref:FAD-binding oxidoreductase n=1 Tax=Rhizobium sullae TaxID=50338 RepID=A0ABY5XHI9_RHISU|nr:FAD-dependent oxidoreductase [Rhizobium sullae]UWU13897.1 FAD-binding oxidoreductase [Rhizobium sullae]